MERINFQTIFLSFIAIPIISIVSIWIAYLYIVIFMISIGWVKKKPTSSANEVSSKKEHI